MTLKSDAKFEKNTNLLFQTLQEFGDFDSSTRNSQKFTHAVKVPW